MISDYISFKENQNLITFEIVNKKKYYTDLINIENSWTGRLDAQICNTFILESSQLIINSIVLFEKGYFDCAFYSLRQSLESSTTMVYLTDIDDAKKESTLLEWKRQSKFPMYNQMINILTENKLVFSDIKNNLNEYFNELEIIKRKLNKYVHKQGFKTFYISRNHPLNKINNSDRLLGEFQEYLKKCIGAVAVFRLSIDPFPVLLGDIEIFRRTGDLMISPYTDDFIEEYIGKDTIEKYKLTTLYKNYYSSIISEEAQEECVNDVIKYQYIDSSKIEKILEQKHLLSINDIIAVSLFKVGNHISKVYCIGGLHWYFSDTKTNRIKTSWDSRDFDKFKSNSQKYNLPYDEVFISCILNNQECYYIEHNKKLTKSEIKKLEQLSF